MPIIAKDSGGEGDFSPMPQGTHLAVCNMVIDLGNQETTFNGEKKVKHQVYLRFETPHERIDWKDDKGEERNGPRVIGKTYTVSLSNKANLRRDLEAWRGRVFTETELAGFDLVNVLGVPCMITVTHDAKGEKTYANIASVTGVPKGMEKPKAELPLLKYAPDDPGDFEELPEWLQNKIKAQKAVDPRPYHSDDPGPSIDQMLNEPLPAF